jgi:hypothetical protein
MLGTCTSFPSTAVFNTRIDDTTKFKALSTSGTWIGDIGNGVPLHADWGPTVDPTSSIYYGIPFNLLTAGAPETDWPGISFGSGTAPDESDCAIANTSGGYDVLHDCTTKPASSLRFPMPRDNVIKLEGGTCNDPNTCGDRHVLVVEQGACRLWESYLTYRVGSQWTVYSTAEWSLSSNAMRPDTWTSGDAAGLPIAPLLARADEASTGQINHAFRVTLRDAVLLRQHVWPARHDAGGSSGAIPYGAVLRLKAGVAIPSSWTTQAKALATAMQRYGLYVADIGTDMYVQGDPNSAWSASTISQIQTLHASDFEFVDMSPITSDSHFDPDSFAASW